MDSISKENSEVQRSYIENGRNYMRIEVLEYERDRKMTLVGRNN